MGNDYDLFNDTKKGGGISKLVIILVLVIIVLLGVLVCVIFRNNDEESSISDSDEAITSSSEEVVTNYLKSQGSEYDILNYTVRYNSDYSFYVDNSLDDSLVGVIDSSSIVFTTKIDEKLHHVGSVLVVNNISSVDFLKDFLLEGKKYGFDFSSTANTYKDANLNEYNMFITDSKELRVYPDDMTIVLISDIDENDSIDFINDVLLVNQRNKMCSSNIDYNNFLEVIDDISNTSDDSIYNSSVKSNNGQSSNNIKDVEIIKKYKYREYGFLSYVYKIKGTKDNSLYTLDMTVYDKDGNIVSLGSDTCSLNKGDIGILTVNDFGLDDSLNRDDLKYDLEIKRSDSFLNVDTINIDITYNISGDKVYLTAKNKSDKELNFVSCYVLYFKDNKLVKCNQTYFDSLKPNESSNTDDWVYGLDFDSIEIVSVN